jgi:hypothetical protein
MKHNATLVSAHDLGGANQLLYATRRRVSHYYALTGPALKVAESLNLSNVLSPDSVDLSDFPNLLVASNVTEQYSDLLMQSAISRGDVKVTGYLDHWVNYSSRWRETPHRVIVSDIRAYFAAIPHFGSRVRLHQNYYVEALRRHQESLLSSKSIETGNVALIVLQPIDRQYQHIETLSSCYCRDVVRFLKQNQVNQLIFRNHVDTRAEFCAEYLKNQYTDIAFEVSHWSTSLEHDLVKATVVIGMDSYALFVAKKLGKTVYSVGRRRSRISPKYPPL